MKNEPILLTGGTGFLGKYVIESLLENGYTNITALYRGPKPELNNVQWVKADILDPSSMENVWHPFSIIIHLAAKVSYHKIDYHTLYKTNVIGTRNLVDLAIASSVKKFLFVSTASTLTRLPEPFEIKEIPEGQTVFFSHYAKTKFLAELEVWRGAAEGLDIKILNPALIIGKGPWTRGSMSIFNAVKNDLWFYPTGSLGIIYAKDVADIIIKSLMDPHWNAQHVLVAENWSWKDFLNEIASSLHRSDIPFASTNWLNSIFKIYSKWFPQKTLSPETISIANLPIIYNLHQYYWNRLTYPFKDIKTGIKEIVRENFNVDPASTIED